MRRRYDRRLHVLTVFDHRGVAAVRVLVRSIRERHADARVTAAFVGVGAEPHVDGARVLSLDETWGSETWWPSVALSAPDHLDGVVIAPLLRAAVAEDDGPVVYLGHQSLVVAALDPLLEALGFAEVALVAMAERGLPDDGELPTAAAVADAGVVNRRIVALRRGAGAERLLASWPTVADGADDQSPPELVADSVQRHLDRFATLDDAACVLQDPGLGVAYWNVPMRTITRVDGVLMAGDTVLRLLDVSGFDPGQPGLPWPMQTRFKPSANPELSRLLDAHGHALRQEVVEPGPDRPSLRHDHHGRPLDVFLRGLIAEAVAEAAVKSPPWTPKGARELDTWLNEPGERGASFGISRYHYAIWEEQRDLRGAYPFLDGPDGPGYVGWLLAYGARDLGIPPALLPQSGAVGAAAGPGEDPVPPWGVNVAGFFRSELGLGEAARLLIAGLDAATVPALPVQGALVPSCRQEAEFAATAPAESPYPINIVCMNGDSIPVFARELPSTFFSERHTIALWWWEIVGAFPEGWNEAFEYVDEIWVATDHILQAVAPHSPKPVLKMPMPVTLPRLQPFDRASLGLPAEGFTFLYMFDYNSTAARKNPVGHVEAFKRAFPPGSGPKLVLKCINGDKLPAQHERTLLAVDGHPDITIIDRYVSADEKNAMLAACDCYVSLHRSEGFGLTPAEAMALGKPVIATRYGGTLEFMTDETAYLVDHRPVAVGPGAHPYPPTGIWVEPDIDHAAALMRRVVERPAEAREVGRRAARYIAEHHSPVVAGRAMRQRLETVYSSITETYERPALDTIPRMAGLGERIDSDPPAPNGPVRRSVRKASSRLASPFVARERRIDQELYRGVVGLQEDVDRLVSDVVARSDGLLREERTLNLAAFRRIRTQLADQQRWLATLEARLDGSRAFRPANSALQRWIDPVVGEVEGFRSPLGADAGSTGADADGGRDARVDALRHAYAALLEGFAPVLDCGCGSGELLEALRDAGIEARGVDADPTMVDLARSCGLIAEQADATQTLDRFDAEALGSVTALDLIEHPPDSELLAFLRAAHRALRPGGRLVLETADPHADAVTKPHPTPVLLPELILERCREVGFSTGFLFHANGSGAVGRGRGHSPSWTVVAEVATHPR